MPKFDLLLVDIYGDQQEKINDEPIETENSHLSLPELLEVLQDYYSEGEFEMNDGDRLIARQRH